MLIIREICAELDRLVSTTAERNVTSAVVVMDRVELLMVAIVALAWSLI